MIPNHRTVKIKDLVFSETKNVFFEVLLEGLVNEVEVGPDDVSPVRNRDLERGAQPLHPLSCQPSSPILLKVNHNARNLLGASFFLQNERSYLRTKLI
jgi:hypothetical protein